MTSVPFHIDHDDREYSLVYVHETEAAATEDAAGRSVPTLIQELALDERYFGLYSASEIDAESVAAVDLPELGSTDTYIVESILGLFDVIDDEQDLTWYKPIEPEALVEAINRVEWQQPVPVVGGQLLSNLILAHGLPNANHRTAIAFLDAYLATIEPAFDPPATITATNEWVSWVDTFIVDSKRLLTLTNNARLFSWLAAHGATVIERKDGIEIRLQDYPLDVDDPWAHFSAAHERRSQEFVEQYIREAGVPELGERHDDGKQAFVSRL